MSSTTDIYWGKLELCHMVRELATEKEGRKSFTISVVISYCVSFYISTVYMWIKADHGQTDRVNCCYCGTCSSQPPIIIVLLLFMFYYSDYARAIKKFPIVKAGHGVHVQALIDIEANDTEQHVKQVMNGN